MSERRAELEAIIRERNAAIESASRQREEGAKAERERWEKEAGAMLGIIENKRAPRTSWSEDGAERNAACLSRNSGYAALRELLRRMGEEEQANAVPVER